MNAPEARKPVSLRTLQQRVKSGRKIPVLTCYDATTARWLHRGGVDVMLVGDTAAEMILGHPRTLHAPLDFMIQITAAVKRGAPEAFVMADMPFMSYQVDDAEALRHAGRFMTEGLADAVKLEVDASFAPLVEKMARAGVPVVAHLGARPQQAARVGGYRAAGRSAEEARAVVDAARDMAHAGAAMLLLEATTMEVSRAVVESTDLPVIGCGAGPACHGHVIVLHDLLGLTEWQPPFAPPAADLGASIRGAAEDWCRRVEESAYPDADHPYRMDDEQRRRFEGA